MENVFAMELRKLACNFEVMNLAFEEKLQALLERDGYSLEILEKIRLSISKALEQMDYVDERKRKRRRLEAFWDHATGTIMVSVLLLLVYMILPTLAVTVVAGAKFKSGWFGAIAAMSIGLAIFIVSGLSVAWRNSKKELRKVDQENYKLAYYQKALVVIEKQISHLELENTPE